MLSGLTTKTVTMRESPTIERMPGKKAGFTRADLHGFVRPYVPRSRADPKMCYTKTKLCDSRSFGIISPTNEVFVLRIRRKCFRRAD